MKQIFTMTLEYFKSDRHRSQISHFKYAWKIIAIFYVIVIGVYLIFQFWFTFPFLYSAEKTEGKIVETYHQDHCTCRYKYMIEGKEFFSNGKSCCQNPVGKVVDVFYLKSDPERSILTSPNSAFWSPFIEAIFGLIVFPLIGAFGFYLKSFVTFPKNNEPNI